MVFIGEITKIFISALWVWIYIFYHFSKKITIFLGNMLHQTPNFLLVYNDDFDGHLFIKVKAIFLYLINVEINNYLNLDNHKSIIIEEITI